MSLMMSRRNQLSKSRLYAVTTHNYQLSSQQIRLASTSQATTTSSKHDPTSTNSSPVRQIAVLGAGLSGLTHALYLARGLSKGKGKEKEYKIVVYDSADRVGGWVKSERRKLNGQGDDKSALIESGPRSIRMAGLGGLSMLELVATLNLGDQLITVPKTTPSAYQRMIRYGNRLHTLPFNFRSLISCFLDKSHLIHKVNPAELLNALKFGNRKPIRSKFPDESVEQFLTRTLRAKDKEGNVLEQEQNSKTPPALVEYLLSAMLHGIYAADASQLSIRSVFPQLYHPALAFDRLQNTWLPFPFNGRMKPYFLLAEEGEEWAKTELAKSKMRMNETVYFKRSLGKDIVDLAEQTSVISFRDGIQSLTDAIARECSTRGVEFRLKSDIQEIKFKEIEGKAIVQLKDQSKQSFDRLISSVPSTKLQNLLSDVELPHLTANPSSTVCVINFAIPPEFNVSTPQAFGYLVPRASAKEGDNSIGHLGTVFDSEAVPGQDNYTKLTLMFGGPFWKPGYMMHETFNDEKKSQEEIEGEAIGLAIMTLIRDLPNSGMDLKLLSSPKVIKKVNLQKDCIPTYTPGHLERMNDLHETLRKKDLMPLSVLGASYTGVSLNDCVLNARRSALRIVLAEEFDEEKNLTGLEDLLAA